MSDQLFTAFSSSSKEEWQQKVIDDLKGKPIDDFFIEFDAQIAPVDFLAHSDDLPDTISAIQRKANNNWNICEQIIVTNATLANEQALLALEQGANSIHFILPEKVSLDVLCQGIIHKYIHTSFSGEGVSIDTPTKFKTNLERNSEDPDKISCSFTSEDLDIDLIKNVIKIFKKGKGIRIQNAETSIVKEISQILAQLNQIFESLTDQGIPKESLGNCFYIGFNAKDNFYTSIASIRAIHLVVSQLKVAWELPQSLIDISAVVIPSNKEGATKDSQKINSTTQAMAAVIGGVSELTLLPLVNEEDAVANESRILRNIQHVMQLESFMNRVVDPSAGSYFIENLTEKIAEAAWNDFRQNWSAKQ